MDHYCLRYVQPHRKKYNEFHLYLSVINKKLLSFLAMMNGTTLLALFHEAQLKLMTKVFSNIPS